MRSPRQGQGQRQRATGCCVHSEGGGCRSELECLFRFLDSRWKSRAARREPGMDRGTEVAILAGVSPGDSLVVKGPESLHDGDKVENPNSRSQA